MIDFKKYPKIELHAHLSGSISTEFLNEIISSDPDSSLTSTEFRILQDYKSNDIEQCFGLFKTIHSILKSLEIIRKCVSHVIEDFHSDGVVYLELRSTLREIGSNTKFDYLKTVVEAIDQHPLVTNNKILVNFIVSIDRSSGLNDGLKTFDALEHYIKNSICAKTRVVGIDLSGNPKYFDLKTYIPLLNRARELGLKTAVHLAEINCQYEDWLNLLKFHIPNRIGHGTALLSNQDNSLVKMCIDIIKDNVIPLEACLTSNVKSKSVASFKEHHFYDWFKSNHPISLCTDDSGVFSTKLSNEFRIAYETWKLEDHEIDQITRYSYFAAFLTGDQPKILKAMLINHGLKL